MNTMATHGEPQLLDKVTMAKRLKISPRHLFNLTRAGKIPAVRLGESVRYDPADVFAAIKENNK